MTPLLVLLLLGVCDGAALRRRHLLNNATAVDAVGGDDDDDEGYLKTQRRNLVIIFGSVLAATVAYIAYDCYKHGVDSPPGHQPKAPEEAAKPPEEEAVTTRPSESKFTEQKTPEAVDDARRETAKEDRKTHDSKKPQPWKLASFVSA
mmetsp:Transcript_24221/g.78102  ORF Transcript_24221/g.78102 Transcript_24221/m.78102 type:complete len:148 (-) Transcript_24221:196-639(-)